MQSKAQMLKEEQEELAKKNTKTQFSERLLNPTAGSRNLLRCLEVKNNPQGKSITSPAPAIKSITAKDLIMQHKQKLLEIKATQMKSQPTASPTPQLGRGISRDQGDIDLSEEVVILLYFRESKI